MHGTFQPKIELSARIVGECQESWSKQAISIDMLELVRRIRGNNEQHPYRPAKNIPRHVAEKWP